MAIHGAFYTRLTHPIEKLLVKLGGANPNTLLRHDELSRALIQAIETMYCDAPGLFDSFADRILAELTPEERNRFSALADAILEDRDPDLPPADSD